LSDKKEMGDKIKKTLNNLVCGIPLAIASFLPINNSYGQMIPKDKQLHLGAGFVIGTWGYFTNGDKYGWKRARNGMIAVTVAGVGKETFDVMCGGKFDLKDLAADYIGGIVSIGILKLCSPKDKHHLMTYGPTSINYNSYAFRNSPVRNKNKLYD
jgi:hypothetical protein